MGWNRGKPFFDGGHPAAGRLSLDRLLDKVLAILAKTPLNQAPEIELTALVPDLPENADTAERIAVAEITISDDGLGTNTLSLTGADAAHFEIDGNTLYLKAGTVLDYETKSAFDVTVVVDDPDIGSGPEDSQAFQLEIADVPESPDLDILLANYGQTNQLLTNDGSGNFATSELDGPAFNSTDIELGDVDGDGDLDALVANSSGQLNHLLINDGSGGFTQTDLPGSEFSQDIELGDLDGDGDLDAVIANSSTVNQLLFNDGTGGFTLVDLPAGATGSNAAALGDVDADGDLDILFGRVQEDQLLINDGDGNFTSTTIGGTGGFTTDVAFGDLDGDGDLDAVLLKSSGSSQILRNDGAGNFTVEDLVATSDFGLSATGNAVALGDLDNDGDLDAILARGSVDRVLINDGTGQFTISNLDDPGWESSDVDLFDYDDDGDLDAFVTNTLETAPNHLYVNEGGTFVTVEMDGGQSQAAAIGDVDGDGGVDPVNEDGLPNIDSGTDLVADSGVAPLV